MSLRQLPANTVVTRRVVQVNEPSLLELLATVQLEDLLPHQGRASAQKVHGPLTLLDSLELTSAITICIVRDWQGEIFSLPLLQDGVEIRRVRAGDGATEALLCLHELSPTSNFSLKLWHRQELQGERAIGVDQTEESIIIGERAIAKWFTHINPSANSSLPRIEALRAAGFTAMPTPWLSLEWKEPRSKGAKLVAFISDFLPGTRDGWEWATQDLEKYLQGNSTLEGSTDFATEVAALITQMHCAFINSVSGPSGQTDVALWLSEFSANLSQAQKVTSDECGQRLHIAASKIRDWLSALTISEFPTLTLIHGDLHIGQILRSESGIYSIIDFDGNPTEHKGATLNLEPLVKDLAGMLQSIDHVGRVVAKRTDNLHLQEIELWIKKAQEKFQNAYLLNMPNPHENPFAGEDLLLLFQFQQEFREFLYANSYLPNWVYVPDTALPALVERI